MYHLVLLHPHFSYHYHCHSQGRLQRVSEVSRNWSRSDSNRAVRQIKIVIKNPGFFSYKFNTLHLTPAVLQFHQNFGIWTLSHLLGNSVAVNWISDSRNFRCLYLRNDWGNFIKSLVYGLSYLNKYVAINWISDCRATHVWKISSCYYTIGVACQLLELHNTCKSGYTHYHVTWHNDGRISLTMWGHIYYMQQAGVP